jgi:uncharacterized protein YutE (UPF0331/DUF86 family)
MISIDKITRKFIQLDEYLQLLKKISETPKSIFLEDKILIGSAKYYLQVSIECCLDVANHIIASERFRAPKDYADSFKVIQEQGLVSFDLGERLRQMTKFRNRLVHLYTDIDNSYVYQFIQDDLKDIEKFRETIMKKYATDKEHGQQ